MFTGLVETVGRVVEATRRGGLLRIGIASALPVAEMADGESVAVDGVCLTVIERRGDRFWSEVIPETSARTTLGRARAGARVNLERALRVGDRLGGHLVQGHADGTTTVRAVRRRAADHRLVLELVPRLGRYLALKGSLTLQGVSLTVAEVAGETFEVALIPETLERTTLGQARAGDRLNLEVDLVARYLERLASGGDPPLPGEQERT